MVDKLNWYNEVQNIINDDLDRFYDKFYNATLVKVGGSFRINPCPRCDHSSCCTVTGNTLHCFSCGWKGTHITAWKLFAQEKRNMSEDNAMEALENYTGISFSRGSEEDAKAYKAYQTRQKILREAEIFYHDKLISETKKFKVNDEFFTPLEYLLSGRKRDIKTIKDFHIGFSGENYFDLTEKLLNDGFSKEEIKEAKIWTPKNVLVYFYKHPVTHDIIRMNIKNPFKTKAVEKNEFGKYIETDRVLEGYSTFSKAMLFTPDFDFKKKMVIIVEGENDLGAIYEQGFSNVAALGGQVKKDESSQLVILRKLPSDAIIYTMFDNDSAGDKYLETIDEFFPDRKIYKIEYNKSVNDPDEYYTKADNPMPIEKLMEAATPLPVNGYRVYREGCLWVIADRVQKLEFTLKNMGDKNIFKGTAIYYKNGILSDRDDDIALTKCKKAKPLNIHLYNDMEKYFNTDIDRKNIDELISVYQYSQKKDEIIRKIASDLNRANNDEELVNTIKILSKKHIFNSVDFVDSILKESNDIQNRSHALSTECVPKMRLGQYYNVKNQDAYMYYTCIKVDGDVKRKLPFLLRNDGKSIRLDLLKRKDAQCLLLVDNKYELPREIPEAVLELDECSLTQYWVNEFAENNIPDNELEPGYLIKKIESYIKKFYYTNDDTVYKIVSLYIYATYYYELFAQIPYLFLNGSKGSGKSVLDECIRLFSFNCKMAVDITEAALFRILSIEGGTLILDEMENLSSKDRTTSNSMAAILKGGYARSGKVFRVNTEKGGAVEKFSIYGPKIISNIMGMDDVIEDRCIVINTYPLKLTKESKMEDPKYYSEEKLDEIREVTSKCAISALRNFTKLHNIYNDSLFETNNARLSQILTPIKAVATLVDSKSIEEARMNGIDDYVGEYGKALDMYWETTLKFIKENIESDTPEGIIKKSVSIIARELWGIIPVDDIELTKTSNHKYAEQIQFNKEEGWFRLNTVHMKCFLEEMKPGEKVNHKLVPRWMNTVFKMKNGSVTRRTIKIENEDLLNEFSGNARPKVYHYTFMFKDFINIGDSFLDKKKDKDKCENTMPLF